MLSAWSVRNGGDVPLASSDASADELATGVFELKDAERAIVFRDVPQRPALSFLRGFTAPVKVEDDLTEEDLVVLSRHDSDNFNRWQSLQSLATRILMRAVKAIRAGERPSAARNYRRRLRRADRGCTRRPRRLRLRGAGDEPAERRRTLRARSARTSIRCGLRGAQGACAARSVARAEGLAALHAELVDSSPFSPDAAAAGRRALRNVALSLFGDGDVIEELELAQRQLADADNMTERFGALAAIALKPDSARERALEAFGRRYAMEPLILDKWYSLQAQIPEPKRSSACAP